MNRYYGFYPNRTLCDVLSEMRKCYDSRNFAGLPGMIEELQIMGNRMEAKLQDNKDIKDAQEYKDKLKKEIRELENQKEELEDGKTDKG